jgi:flagella basal body P-ring formation protein FlgA
MAVNRLTLRASLRAFCAALLLAQPPAWAGDAGGAAEAWQDLAAVRSSAERALRAQLDPDLKGVELSARALDPRLRVRACPTKPETRASAPRGTQTRVLVQVSCPGIPWSLNVPVDIRREFDVLVMRRPAARGESLAAADVSVQKRVLPGLASPFVGRVEDLQNRLARRPLAEGTAITADSLTAALLIKRGQTVVLAASAGGIEVRAPGLALADATARQRLRVQNLDSLKVVEGVAEAEGVVRVTL